MLVIQQVPMILKEDRRPYPVCVDEDGTIGQQSHHGVADIRFLVGFQRSMATQAVNLWRAEWFNDPQTAVGMYPVVSDGENKLATLEAPVETVEERPGQRAADIP